MNVKFGVFADLHIDFIHDGVERMQEFLEKCSEENVDFCIQLGDFCPPNGSQDEAKTEILKNIKDFQKPFYHILGNRDMDVNSKEEVLSYIQQKQAYYSFDCGDVHFAVLDACFFEQEGRVVSYQCGNYKDLGEGVRVPVLPPEQLQWLEQDLNKTNYPTVIFTHQSLVESRSGIQNAKDFRKVAERAPKGVLMAVCGHEHVDRLEEKEGIQYWCVNSMSYYWAGSKYRHKTYDTSITGLYPKLERVFPYSKPVYAFVEVVNDEICIKGKCAEIIGSTPEEIQFEKKGLEDPITAEIIDRKIKIPL